MQYDFTQQVHSLEEKLSHANAVERLRLQPKVQTMVDRIVADGQRVPTALSQINQALTDESFDDRFDNMPI